MISDTGMIVEINKKGVFIPFFPPYIRFIPFQAGQRALPLVAIPVMASHELSESGGKKVGTINP